MTSFILWFGLATAFMAVAFLLIKVSKEAGREEQRAENAEDVAQETARQARALAERSLDSDTVSRLRSKASLKRKLEADRDG